MAAYASEINRLKALAAKPQRRQFGKRKTEMYYGRKWSGITPEKFMQQVDAPMV
ncbi:integrase core -containing domain protein [Escherichia coli 2-011-08_S1_C1]|nr:integrase core -containing domain protein [Escherichia coli 2-011-08_S1_C1]